MRLLVGLGNPGAEYAHNRHNIGFLAVDAIAEKYRFAPWRARFQGHTAEGFINGMKVVALKPNTYMNLSGQAVGEALRFFKLAPEDVVVLYDEIEITPGKIRVKKAGGSAGHNGIKSIDSHIGPDYWRVRLGVGRPEGQKDVSNHVLSNFSKADAAWLGPFLDAVAGEIPWMMAGNDSKFMTRVSLLTQPSPEKKTPEKKPKPEKAETKTESTESK
jgi:PTH1 family peptidyl-tRNA hydrolase